MKLNDPNECQNNEQTDKLFYNSIIKSDKIHISPDYKQEGNPNTGDDLALIELDESIIETIEHDCKFWNIGDLDELYHDLLAKSLIRFLNIHQIYIYYQ